MNTTMMFEGGKMTGREVLEKVQEAQKELDKFNLTIAEYRVKNGMSQNLRDLYKKMGDVDYKLTSIAKVCDFSELVDKLEERM